MARRKRSLWLHRPKRNKNPARCIQERVHWFQTEELLQPPTSGTSPATVTPSKYKPKKRKITPFKSPTIRNFHSSAFISSPIRKRIKVKSSRTLFDQENENENEFDDLISIEQDIETNGCGQLEMPAVKQKAEADEACLKTSENSDNEMKNKMIEEMQRLLPEVMKKLAEVDGVEDAMYVFFKQVVSGQFPLNNISFLLWTDVVRWFNLKNTTQMRYSEETKKFWKLGWRLFGGRFVNFLGGYKNDSDVVQGLTEKGKYCPAESSINFAIPDQKVLRSFCPYGESGERKPGIFQDIMSTLSSNAEHQSSCLTYDGKKLKQGLTESSGDVDLLGFENGVTLKERKEFLDNSISEINMFIDQLHQLDNQLVAIQLTTELKQNLCKILHKALKEISEKIHSVKELERKKEYCKAKLIERGGDTNWRKGKYVYAISAIIAFLYDIDQFLKHAMSALDSICQCISYLNNAEYVSGSTVNLNESRAYIGLQEQDETDTRFIHQRSQKWFELRHNAKVTGSTMYKALGFDGLNKQKEYFEQVICGIPEAEHTQVVLDAMKHGTDNEPNAVATIVGKVLPVIHPDLIFCEEGCVEIKDTNNKTFMVVSPDGSLRVDNRLDSTYVAVEIKCPVRQVHTKFPPRYLLQCLAEIESLSVDSLLYVSWTQDVTTVFRVKRDLDFYKRAMKLAYSLYGPAEPKKPTKLNTEVRVMKKEMESKCKDIELIGQFSSATCGNDNNTYASKPFNVKSLECLLEEVNEVTLAHFELSREKASEAMVFLCADLDRGWKKDKIKCAPVAWFPKGYSLQTETLRHIAEDVHSQCHFAGIHIPCQSFDGQWHNVVVRSIDGKPLTTLQLQKDVWKEVEQMKKGSIIAALKELNRDPKWEVKYSGQERHTRVIEVSNEGTRLPLLRLNGSKNKKGQNDPKEPLQNQPTLVDVLPDVITFYSDVSEDVLAMANIDQDIEKEALSIKVNENNSAYFLTDDTEETDNDTTVSDDLKSKEGNEQNMESPTVSNTVIINKVNLVSIDYQDAEHILLMLRTDCKCNKKGTWNDRNADYLLEYLASVEQLKKMTDIELRVIVRFIKKTKNIPLKESVSKQTKLQQLVDILGLGSGGTLPTKQSNRKKTAKSLSDLAAETLSKKVSKQDLNVAYAEHIWPIRYKNWKQESALASSPTIDETNEPNEWFYLPEYSNTRQQLEVRCIDSTHLFTRTRRKSCKGGLDGTSKEPWIKVAKARKTFLTQIMVEEITDPMSASMAKTHFSGAVENEMRANGDVSAAELCKDIRTWWESEDKPGIPAHDRIQMRLTLRKRLLKRVNFSTFPPVTMFVCGWPIQLWEALVANIDAKALLYALCHGATYNVRAFSSMIGETFFSELTLNDKRGQGTVTSQEFGQFIGTTIEQVQMRLDPKRDFIYRTCRSTAYKLVEDADEIQQGHSQDTCNACHHRGSTFISTIQTKNHYFDSEERNRLEGRKKQGTVSTMRNSLQKGALGVRYERARRNESKMLLTKKMGIDDSV